MNEKTFVVPPDGRSDAERRDALLLRLLKTPPQPHAKPDKQRKKAGQKRAKR